MPPNPAAADHRYRRYLPVLYEWIRLLSFTFGFQRHLRRRAPDPAPDAATVTPGLQATVE